MKIPNGMTESEVVKIIDSVSNRYCENFKFGYYTAEDIKQEAFIIAMDGLERYDGSSPLENFLAVHIRNRLIDFKRDNYHRRENTMSEKGMLINERKRAIIHPINIHRVDDELESSMQVENNIAEEISDKIVAEYIDENIEVQYREDYLRFKDGFKLPKVRRQILMQHISDLVYRYVQG